MLAIAQGVRNDQANFYWHLGDFRATYDFDADILAAPEYRGKHMAISEFQTLGGVTSLPNKSNLLEYSGLSLHRKP